MKSSDLTYEIKNSGDRSENKIEDHNLVDFHQTEAVTKKELAMNQEILARIQKLNFYQIHRQELMLERS